MTSSTDLKEWAPFQLLHFADYHYSEGDIYFLAVQTNPLAAQTEPRLAASRARPSLVGLAPVVHRGVGCIGITASLDGIRWSKM